MSLPDSQTLNAGSVNGNSSGSLARNYASGPTSNDNITNVGYKVLWNFVENGASVPRNNVPITPRVSGRVRVTAMIGVLNAALVGTTNLSIQVQAQVDGATIATPLAMAATPDSGATTQWLQIPFQADLTVGLGAHTISILVTVTGSGTAQMLINASTIEIQEIPPATG